MSRATPRRARGRPRGTGYRHDEAMLVEMAIALASGKARSRQEALRQLGETHPSNVRRLQGKFKARRAELETKARRIIAQRPAPMRRADHAYLTFAEQAFRSNHLHARLIGMRAMHPRPLESIQLAKTSRLMSDLVKGFKFSQPPGITAAFDAAKLFRSPMGEFMLRQSELMRQLSAITRFRAIDDQMLSKIANVGLVRRRTP